MGFFSALLFVTSMGVVGVFAGALWDYMMRKQPTFTDLLVLLGWMFAGAIASAWVVHVFTSPLTKW
jgi:F0F1-type ATP synthase assembly protein I